MVRPLEAPFPRPLVALGAMPVQGDLRGRHTSPDRLDTDILVRFLIAMPLYG